jgi:hypothetical protein
MTSMADGRPIREPRPHAGPLRRDGVTQPWDEETTADLKEAAEMRRAWDRWYLECLEVAIASKLDYTAIADLAGISRQAVRQYAKRRFSKPGEDYMTRQQHPDL